MKEAKRLRVCWWLCMGSVAAMALVSWWGRALARGAPPVVEGSMARWLTTLLMGTAVADGVIALWLYRMNWLPLCESALKRVWAGRLVNVAEAQALAGLLAMRSVVIMALAASPAVSGGALALVGAPSTATLVVLVGASVAGLGGFYRYGLQPADGLFRHVERISRG